MSDEPRFERAGPVQLRRLRTAAAAALGLAEAGEVEEAIATLRAVVRPDGSLVPGDWITEADVPLFRTPKRDHVEGLKSTCERRPGCGCSIECRDYVYRALAERDSLPHVEGPGVEEGMGVEGDGLSAAGLAIVIAMLALTIAIVALFLAAS